ncbi:DinB family protein [Pseudotamlana carrageenivorans]|uniref:DinB family protein n=1 Tax=Pseudotamlana carrageenivorans TaxID=2069432 RepID=A0A2I7SHL8_9FLAO|nr:DinB family protein [Tamlana carrageenivorans]AUS05391.1 DinB family protein [Tamlana carrageenivorans]
MDFTFEVLMNTRNIFKGIIETCSLNEVNKIPEGFNNNIIWNIAHSIVTQQLLCYKLSGLEATIPTHLINRYRKGTKPEGAISLDELHEIKDILNSSIEKTQKDYSQGVFKTYTEYTVSTTGNTLSRIEDALQFAVIHEGIHYGYILALMKALKK